MIFTAVLLKGGGGHLPFLPPPSIPPPVYKYYVDNFLKGEIVS